MLYTPRGKGESFDGGDMILNKLKERYTTQAELARSINMHPSKLNEIIKGFRRPSKRELQDISTTLDISITEWRKQSNYVNAAFPVLGNKFDNY